MDQQQAILELAAEVHQGNERMARIETLLETEAERCPYREDISEVPRHRKRIGDLEKIMIGVRLKVAGVALLSGGGGGALMAAFIAKVMGEG